MTLGKPNLKVLLLVTVLVATLLLVWIYNAEVSAPRSRFDLAITRLQAVMGLAKAQAELGLLYCNGSGALAAEDHAEAVKWFTKAADKGEIRALWHLGEAYCTGDLVTKDEAKGEGYLRTAAERGDLDSGLLLARLYAKGAGEVHQDAGKSAMWYRSLADLGQPAAMYELGLLYVSGNGVPKDLVSAHQWLNLASALGSAEAKARLPGLEQGMSAEQIVEANKLTRERFEALRPKK